MSDSLKDQLLKAGFKAPEKTAPKASAKNSNHKKSKPDKKRSAAPGSRGKSQNRNHERTSLAKAEAARKELEAAEQAREVAQRKKIKAEIKILIEENLVKEATGEIAYSYMVRDRVKQLFVTTEVRQKLANDELVITRLNGSTHVITPEVAEKIIKLNPDWAIIRNTPDDKSSGETNDGYEGYQIPDDITW